LNKHFPIYKILEVLHLCILLFMLILWQTNNKYDGFIFLICFSSIALFLTYAILGKSFWSLLIILLSLTYIGVLLDIWQYPGSSLFYIAGRCSPVLLAIGLLINFINAKSKNSWPIFAIGIILTFYIALLILTSNKLDIYIGPSRIVIAIILIFLLRFFKKNAFNTFLSFGTRALILFTVNDIVAEHLASL